MNNNQAHFENTVEVTNNMVATAVERVRSARQEYSNAKTNEELERAYYKLQSVESTLRFLVRGY